VVLHGSPAMQPLLVAADADGSVEELGEARFGEELGAGCVGDDAAVAHEDDAVDFGEYVAEVVRHENEAGAFGGEAAEGFAQLALRGEIERVRWLIEQELLRAVDERSGDHDAALFSGGHFADELIGEVRGFHAFEGFAGALAHFIGDMQVGPEGRCGEESCGDGVEAGSDGGAFAGEIGDHDSEVAAELCEVPALAAEDAHVHAGDDHGVDLACHGEDEGGFSAAVGAEDGDVFASADGEVDVVQHDALAARDVDAAHVEKLRMVSGLCW